MSAPCWTALVELHGEYHKHRRLVFVNLNTVTHFAEYDTYQEYGGNVRATKLHTVSGESLLVTEQPEQLAAFLTGQSPRDIAPVRDLLPQPEAITP